MQVYIYNDNIPYVFETLKLAYSGVLVHPSDFSVSVVLFLGRVEKF